MAFQRQARQSLLIIWLSHDLKLCHAGIVAGQKIDRLLKPAGSGAVGRELAFVLRRGLAQFGENIRIAFTAKKEAACSGQFCGIVLKGGQLIHRAKAADVRTDIVRGTEQIAHVEQSRRAGAAPRITAPPTTGRGEK